jgi:hypothetical protein
MSNLVNRSSAELAPASQLNAFEQFGDSVNTNRIVGELLKFVKGDWVVGKDQDELDEGTRLIADVANLKLGWQRWEANKPTDAVFGRLMDGYVPPKRGELGDLDQSVWEIDTTSGKPRDPWQFTAILLLKEEDSDQIYTYSPSAQTAIKALGKLSTAFGQHFRQKPDELPVIVLGQDSFMHKDPRVGRVKIPTFKVVGWVKNGSFAEALAAEAEEAEANAEAEEELNLTPAMDAPERPAKTGKGKTQF